MHELRKELDGMKKTNKRRADGRIAVQVYLGRLDGKRQYKVVYGQNQKEADAAADLLKAKLRKGLDVSSEKDSFSIWCDRWLNIKKEDIGNSQHQSYLSYTKHLKAHLGQTAISKVTTYDIQLLINDLADYNPSTKRPTAKKTLSDIKNTASQVFRLAIDNRIIDYNPALAVSIPKNAPKKERRALTDTEQGWLINTPHRMQCAAMVMMYAGLRRGELIPLLWSDIDFKAKTISVNKSVDLSAGKPKIKPTTKTAAGLRTITIPGVLCDYLKNQQKSSVLVCPSLSGSIYTADSWSGAWETYLYDLDILFGKLPQKKSKYDKRFPGITIPRITPHMLRHTFCTTLYMAGIDVLTAKEQMGHSDIKTTLSIYTHLDSNHKKKEMKKLDDYIKCKSHASQKSSETLDA